MRITKEEKETIVKEAQKQFGAGTKVILFGSRANDLAKGGDIDLLIVPANVNSPDKLYSSKISFSVTLGMLLEEQKIDIIIKYPGDNRGIIQTATIQGIPLY
jgi:predicted nucleotidyltransferase